MLRAPNPPTTGVRLCLGPVGWFFVMTALWTVYLCVFVVWGMLALMYYFYKGVFIAGRWTFYKLTGRRL